MPDAELVSVLTGGKEVETAVIVVCLSGRGVVDGAVVAVIDPLPRTGIASCVSGGKATMGTGGRWRTRREAEEMGMDEGDLRVGMSDKGDECALAAAAAADDDDDGEREGEWRGGGERNRSELDRDGYDVPGDVDAGGHVGAC